MRRTLHRLHVLACWLLVGGIAVQVFLAGAAMSNLGGSGDFGLHVIFGHTVIGLLALAVVLSAVAAGVDRRDKAIAFGLLILYFVQTALPALRSVVPAIAALHAVNALLLFALAAWYARRAMRAPDHGRADATAASAVADATTSRRVADAT